MGVEPARSGYCVPRKALSLVPMESLTRAEKAHFRGGANVPSLGHDRHAMHRRVAGTETTALAMERLEELLLLWLSRRHRRPQHPPLSRSSEITERRNAYQGMTPDVLRALEAALTQWHQTHDLERYERAVQHAVEPLPRPAWAARRLIEPMREACGYRAASELEWLHERLDRQDSAGA